MVLLIFFLYFLFLTTATKFFIRRHFTHLWYNCFWKIRTNYLFMFFLLNILYCFYCETFNNSLIKHLYIIFFFFCLCLSALSALCRSYQHRKSATADFQFFFQPFFLFSTLCVVLISLSAALALHLTRSVCCRVAAARVASKRRHCVWFCWWHHLSPRIALRL